MFSQLKKFKLTPESLEVDGQDISKMTRAVRYTYRVGEVPTLEVELMSQADSVVGEADVKFYAEQDTVEILTLWLSRVDPGNLEQEVLSRLSGFDGKPIAAVYLDVLREWANG